MLDVMFYEVFAEEEKGLRAQLPKNIKAKFTWKAVQECGPHPRPASFISIRTQSIIPTTWAKDLKGILTRSTGYDHILEYRRVAKRNIPSGYLPHYCARAVAEQAILIMLGLWRKFKLQTKKFETFNRDGLTGNECFNKRLLVVGVGNIGRQIVDVAQGLRMEVRGVDLHRPVKKLKYVSLSAGVAWADVIICALPLTPDTHGLLNYRLLQKGRPDKIFINISRGEIAPLKDLARLLKQNKISGLGLDVFEEEKLLAENLRAAKKSNHWAVKIVEELKEKDNVIFTPHNAFNTHEAVERKIKDSVVSTISFLKSGIFPTPIPRA